MTDSDPNPAELGRTVIRIEDALIELTREVRSRHHEIANKVNDALAPISALSVRVDTTAEEVRDLKRQVSRLIWLAGGISGLVSAGAALVSHVKFGN